MLVSGPMCRDTAFTESLTGLGSTRGICVGRQTARYDHQYSIGSRDYCFVHGSYNRPIMRGGNMVCFYAGWAGDKYAGQNSIYPANDVATSERTGSRFVYFLDYYYRWSHGVILRAGVVYATGGGTERYGGTNYCGINGVTQHSYDNAYALRGSR